MYLLAVLNWTSGGASLSMTYLRSSGMRDCSVASLSANSCVHTRAKCGYVVSSGATKQSLRSVLQSKQKEL
jgi:hypothetical protein